MRCNGPASTEALVVAVYAHRCIHVCLLAMYPCMQIKKTVCADDGSDTHPDEQSYAGELPGCPPRLAPPRPAGPTTDQSLPGRAAGHVLLAWPSAGLPLSLPCLARPACLPLPCLVHVCTCMRCKSPLVRTLMRRSDAAVLFSSFFSLLAGE